MGKIDHNKLTKLQYSIGEVADLFGVSTSLIRFWETEFPSIKPTKNRNGKRIFTAKDILSLEKIYVLVKENGFTLDGAKKALKNPSNIEIQHSVENSNDLIIKKLENIKSRLLALKNL